MEITFTPKGTGTFDTTVTVNVTNGDGATTFPTYGAGFTLLPESHPQGLTVDSFPLTLPSPQATASPFWAGLGSITFDPGNAVIEWSGKVSYQTSGHALRSAATVPIATFTASQAPYTVAFGGVPIGVATPSGVPTPNVTYQIAGGQLELNATYNAGASNDPVPTKITGYVTGIPTSPSPGIAYQTITSQLTSLYQTLVIPNGDPLFPISGATTPGLLTQIATLESGSYQQFFLPSTSNKAPFGIVDSWPLESKKTNKPFKSSAGSHIGLLQVPVTQADAWNWVQNTTTGFGVFQAKVNTAYSLADDEYDTYTAVGPPTTLPKLTACQLEEMALELYGPYAEPLESEQYYIPKCVGNITNLEHTHCSGTWQWAINYPKGSSRIDMKERCGVCYVASVREKVHPSPPTGSTSMCSGTSPSPDPPTGLSCKGC